MKGQNTRTMVCIVEPLRICCAIKLLGCFSKKNADQAALTLMRPRRADARLCASRRETGDQTRAPRRDFFGKKTTGLLIQQNTDSLLGNGRGNSFLSERDFADRPDGLNAPKGHDRKSWFLRMEKQRKELFAVGEMPGERQRTRLALVCLRS